MTDYFATLGQPRRPWLDLDRLKQAFHQLASQHHPDVAGTESPDFALLNSAYNTLRDPKSRLQHLLALEGAPAASNQIPAQLGELFMQIAQQQSAAAAFLKKYAAAQSPLAKALLAVDKFKVLEQLQETLLKLEALESALLSELEAADANWDSHRDYAQLQQCSQRLAYLGKWQAQLREATSRLAIDL